jgi:hypothetical protein
VTARFIETPPTVGASRHEKILQGSGGLRSEVVEVWGKHLRGAIAFAWSRWSRPVKTEELIRVT